MTRDRAFEELMASLRAQDGDAAREVFHRFANRLIALARSRLDKLTRPKVDPEDVAQSVFKSFFHRHAQGDFALESWDGLWGMLATIALRKCGHRVKYYRAARRDVHREVGLTGRPEAARPDLEAVALDPTPSEAARLTETLEAVMRGLEGREREILALSLQGYSNVEISGHVGRTERTVQRVLQRVRRRLEVMQAEPEPSEG
jgi:RNA polymerase sigma-70 factor (ECF subfamily)